MLDPPEITDYDEHLLELFWGARGFADDSSAPIPIQSILFYVSLPDEARLEVELIRRMDVAYLEYISELTPERRKNLGRAKLSLVKKRDEEEDGD